MITVTIPREVTRGEELVVIPRKLYDQFVRVLEEKQSFGLRINRGLKEALDDVKKGKTIGPFTTLEEGLRVLKKSP